MFHSDHPLSGLWNLGSNLPVQQKQPGTSGGVYGTLRENGSTPLERSLFTYTDLGVLGPNAIIPTLPNPLELGPEGSLFSYMYLKSCSLSAPGFTPLPKLTDSGNSLQPNLCLPNCKDLSVTRALDRTVAMTQFPCEGCRNKEPQIEQLKQQEFTSD